MSVEGGRSTGPDPRSGQDQGSGPTRRALLLAGVLGGAAAVTEAATGGRWPIPLVSSSPPAINQPHPGESAPATEAPTGSLALRVKNAQVVRKVGNKDVTWGAGGVNVYSAEDVEYCGTALNPTQRKEAFDAAKRAGANTLRTWYLDTEGPLAARQDVLRQTLALANEREMHIILTLFGQENHDGCGQTAKTTQWYRTGYLQDGTMDHIRNTAIAGRGHDNIIYEIVNEVGNDAPDLDPDTLARFLQTTGKEIKKYHPGALVTFSSLADKPLVQPGNLEKVLVGARGAVDMINFHLYTDPRTWGSTVAQQVQIAGMYGYPTQFGEVGMDPGLIASVGTAPYEQGLQGLAQLPTVAGALSWGQILTNPGGNILYATTDGTQFGPNSAQARVFGRVLPAFEHPAPNARNRLAGVSS